MTSNIGTESESGADFLAQKLGAGGSCLHCLMVNPPLAAGKVFRQIIDDDDDDDDDET